jgi:hypothetical protein
MSMIRGRILLAALFVCILSCSAFQQTATLSADTPKTAPSIEPSPTYAPANPFIEIIASPMPGDGRLWTMTKPGVKNWGELYDTECNSSLVISLFESTDNGVSWHSFLSPLETPINQCLHDNNLDLYLSWTNASIFPYEGGYIFELRTHIITEANAFFSPRDSFRFSYSNGAWKTIGLPVTTGWTNNRYSGVWDSIVLPDNTGRIIAIGHDRITGGNAWVYEPVLGAWRDISLRDPILGDNTPDMITWSYRLGIFISAADSPQEAHNSHRLVFHADNDTYQWSQVEFASGDTAPTGGIKNALWTGTNGEVCMSAAGRLSILTDVYLEILPRTIQADPDKKYMAGSPCPSSLAGRNEKNISILASEYRDMIDKGVAVYAWSSPIYLPSVIQFPKNIPDDMMTDFEVSGTGVFYYLAKGTLYSSTDNGKTWHALN